MKLECPAPKNVKAPQYVHIAGSAFGGHIAEGRAAVTEICKLLVWVDDPNLVLADVLDVLNKGKPYYLGKYTLTPVTPPKNEQ